jgi:uncharacterized protein YjgD (DUF1641 family)
MNELHPKLERLLEKLAERSDALEQFAELIGKLHDSGILAAIEGLLEEFDESFNALTRPEPMTMLGNLMMLLGALGRVRYEPFFRGALYAAPALNEKLSQLLERQKPLGLWEAWTLLRRPEVAAALEALVTLLQTLKPPPQNGRRGTHQD